jgi:DNA repair exonuclease SbcCD ATPase subunit
MGSKSSAPPTTHQARLGTRHLLALATCVLAALAVSGCKWFQKEPPKPADSAAATPAALPAAEQKSLEQLAADVDAAQQREAAATGQLATALDQYRKAGGETPANLGGDLTPEQRKAFVDRIQQERGNRQQLLQDILDRDAQIDQLKTEIEEIKKKIPNTESFVVKEGQRHDRIAMDYLIKRGVSADKAYGIVSQTNLYDALLPGFRVWVLYNTSNGQFGTWVTKGQASVSPLDHQRKLTALLRDELAAAKVQSEELRTQLGSVSQELDTAKAEVETKTAEVETARSAAEEAERQRLATENTVSYLVGSKKQLQDAKIIDRGFKLQRIDLPNPQTINLLEADELPLVGVSELRLKKIKKVTLAPREFVPSRDYQVTIAPDQLSMVLRIVDKEKFKRARLFVVAVED